MLHSALILRHIAPIALLAVLGACSSSSTSTAQGDAGPDSTSTLDAKASHDGKTATDTGSHADGSSSHDAVSNADAVTGADSGMDGSSPGVGPAAVALGTAGDYVVLAMSAITNAPTSAITGNLGLSPAAASFITGFSMTRAGTKWTSAQVTGDLFAADNDPPTPVNLGVAVGDMMTAYTDAAGRPTPDFLNDGTGAIGGLTLTPGLYKWTSGVTIASDVVLDGAANDTWIFQVTGNLSMAAAQKVTLIGGAMAKNVVWQVAGSVDFGATSHAEGVVLGQKAITLETGASINGRLLAQTAVNLAGNVIVAP
jgi:hypothetical protein